MNERISVNEIFNDALERPPDDRGAFLRDVCRADERLLRDVQALLAAHDASRDFLGTSALESAVDAQDPAAVLELLGGTVPSVGAVLGKYRLVERVAAGGMGVVFRAVRDDGCFDREVAVKVLPGGFSGEAMHGRFLQERQTLAQLAHPCIARLLDGGADAEGLPFLVMEFVHGRPIDEFCDQDYLPIPDRLQLFRTVCEGVHHAHQNLVVHRDLKPANILVTETGQPKLLDFGIARLIQDGADAIPANVTVTILRALTPRYASPEQVRGGPITTATDIYSLGVILYELLCGRGPYELQGRLSAGHERLICDIDPPAPSARLASPTGTLAPDPDPATDAGEIARRRATTVAQLIRTLRGDLDRIVLRALSKEPRRRYASVQEFSEDIRRYLAGLPVLARRDTILYRVSKFVRRNRALSAATIFAIAALFVGTIAATFGLVRARSESFRAQAERNAALAAQTETQATLSFLQDLLAAANPYRRARNATVLELLADAERRIDHDLSSQPAIEASARYAVAETYAGLWLWPDAARHARRSLEIRRALYGNEDRRVADCLVLLGRALTFAGDPSAEALQREALSIRRKWLGESHPLIADCMVCLGYSLWHAKTPPRWDEAEALYAAGIDMERAFPTTRTEDLARHLFSFGVLLTNLGRYDDAEPRFRESLELYRGVSGGSDRYALECRKKYAHMLLESGRPDDAETILREAIDLLPPGVSNTEQDSPRWLLARVRAKQDRGEEAESLARSVIADAFRQCAISQPAAHDRLMELAARTSPIPDETPESHTNTEPTFRMSRSREAEAELPLASVFQAAFALPLDPRPPLARYIADLGEMLCDLGRFDDASELFQTWSGFAESNVRAVAAPRAIIQSAQAACLAKQGRFDEAHAALTESHRTLSRIEGPTASVTLRSARQLAVLEHRATSNPPATSGNE